MENDALPWEVSFTYCFTVRHRDKWEAAKIAEQLARERGLKPEEADRFDVDIGEEEDE